MRVLVTGGAGFIGSTLVDTLVADGHDVTVLDHDECRLDRLAATQPEVHRLAADVRDSDLGGLIRRAGPEVIFHLAAQIDVSASVADPAHDAEVNVLGTVRVAEAARSAGARKIVFASSGGSIYGPSATLPIAETAALEPVSPYAASKVAGEMYLNSFSRLHGLACTHLAFANVYGPRQDPAGEAGVVAIFSARMLRGSPTTLFGDGGNTRDYVYVADVVQALVLAAGDIGDRRRFNIGTGVQTSDRELHALVAKTIGCADEPSYSPARRGDLRHSALDSSLARQVLAWAPAHDLRQGLERTVEFFRAEQVRALTDRSGEPSQPAAVR